MDWYALKLRMVPVPVGRTSMVEGLVGVNKSATTEVTPLTTVV